MIPNYYLQLKEHFALCHLMQNFPSTEALLNYFNQNMKVSIASLQKPCLVMLKRVTDFQDAFMLKLLTIYEEHASILNYAISTVNIFLNYLGSELKRDIIENCKMLLSHGLGLIAQSGIENKADAVKSFFGIYFKQILLCYPYLKSGDVLQLKQEITSFLTTYWLNDDFKQEDYENLMQDFLLALHKESDPSENLNQIIQQPNLPIAEQRKNSTGQNNLLFKLPYLEELKENFLNSEENTSDFIDIQISGNIIQLNNENQQPVRKESIFTENNQINFDEIKQIKLRQTNKNENPMKFKRPLPELLKSNQKNAKHLEKTTDTKNNVVKDLSPKKLPLLTKIPKLAKFGNKIPIKIKQPNRQNYPNFKFDDQANEIPVKKTSPVSGIKLPGFESK